MRPSRGRIASSSSSTRFTRHLRLLQTMTTPNSPDLDAIVQAVRQRQRFAISSHARPDGDSIGSQLAMACALRALGKEATVVNFDAAPPPLMQFPGVSDIVL